MEEELKEMEEEKVVEQETSEPQKHWADSEDENGG